MSRPHRIDSFSNTCLYLSCAVSQSSRHMLILTRVSSGSIAVFEISVFKFSMNSNCAFFTFSSVVSLFVVRFPTKWLIWMFFASFPSVLYLLKSTIGQLSPRSIMLSSSVSTGPWAISPPSVFFQSSSSIG